MRGGLEWSTHILTLKPDKDVHGSERHHLRRILNAITDRRINVFYSSGGAVVPFLQVGVQLLLRSKKGPGV